MFGLCNKIANRIRVLFRMNSVKVFRLCRNRMLCVPCSNHVMLRLLVSKLCNIRVISNKCRVMIVSVLMKNRWCLVCRLWLTCLKFRVMSWL